MPYWASALNQHFCLQAQKPNSKCCNGKRSGLAHTGENSSRAHGGTLCSTCDYESLCMSSLLSTWMALFLSQAGSPSRWKKAALYFRFMSCPLNKPAEREPQLPMIFCKISWLHCIVSPGTPAGYRVHSACIRDWNTGECRLGKVIDKGKAPCYF